MSSFSNQILNYWAYIHPLHTYLVLVNSRSISTLFPSPSPMPILTLTHCILHPVVLATWALLCLIYNFYLGFNIMGFHLDIFIVLLYS